MKNFTNHFHVVMEEQLTFLKYPPCSRICPFKAGRFLNRRPHSSHSWASSRLQYTEQFWMQSQQVKHIKYRLKDNLFILSDKTSSGWAWQVGNLNLSLPMWCNNIWLSTSGKVWMTFNSILLVRVWTVHWHEWLMAYRSHPQFPIWPIEYL